MCFLSLFFNNIIAAIAVTVGTVAISTATVATIGAGAAVVAETIKYASSNNSGQGISNSS